MSNIKVIIVEDEFVIAKSIEYHIIQSGYECIGIASSGEELNTLINKKSPDIILMDVMISGSDNGIVLAEKIKEKYNIPIVFLTAYSDKKLIDQARLTQPYGYLIKPVTANELAATIEIAVSKHQQHIVTKLEKKKIQEDNSLLELLVQERTRNLVEINKQLVNEINEKSKIQYELKQSQNELKRNEARLREFMESLPETLFEINENAIVTYANKTAYNLFQYNYSKKELEQKNIFELIHPISHEGIKKYILHKIAGNNKYNNEHFFIKKDGSAFGAQIYTSVIKENDSFKGFRGMLIDFTEKRKHEIELQKLKHLQQLERENFEKEMSLLLIKEQESERKRISMDIHDSLGQILTATKLNLASIISNKNLPADSKIKLNHINKFLKEAILETRKISNDLMPAALQDFGIFVAIKQLLNNENIPKTLKTKFEYNNEINKLDKNIEISIYRVIQETLSNTIKYSKASQYSVIINSTLQESNNELILEIEDNGIGFVYNNQNYSISHGLNNIHQRIHLLSGSCTIATSPNKGCKYKIHIPINNEKQN